MAAPRPPAADPAASSAAGSSSDCGSDGETASIRIGDGQVLIRASAGSGKTFQLSNRYLALLRRCPPERILAVTFTRKAAAEILDRVLNRLAAAALDAEERRRLGSFIGDISEEECLQLLAGLTRQLHRVRIGTLDGFFSRLASSLSLEIGLPPDWRIVDEHADRDLQRRAIDAVLHERNGQFVGPLVNLLAKGDSPRSIGRLIEDAVANFYDVSRLVPAAAWSRIPQGGVVSGEELQALIAQVAALRLPPGGQLAKARNKDLALIEVGDWLSFMGSGPAAKLLAGETKYYRAELPEELVAAYRALLAHARGILLKAWSEQNDATRQLLDRYHEARRRLLLETGSIRFNDVASALAERVSAIDGPTLVHRLDMDLDHMLIDEFQDTSLNQWRVLRPFVEDVVQRPRGTFFCVGDVKQAIYGWRGGVAALFDKVARETPGIQEQQLNASRRSSPPVIEAVNEVFLNLSRHLELGEIGTHVDDWRRAFPRHATVNNHLSGYVRLESSDLLEGNADEHRLACSARAADLVAELMQTHPRATIGVLAQRNAVVARTMYDLGQRGILASEEGGVPMTNSAAVQLVQSVLRFADHPAHSIARFHAAHSPLGPLLGIEAQMSDKSAHAAALAIREELARTGYEAAVARWAAALRPLCNSREWSRLRRLRGLAAAWQPEATLRCSDFADRIDNEKVEEPSESRVRVMTIHKAKGLEFDIVILPDLDTKLCDVPAYAACGPGPAELPDTILVYRNQALTALLPPELQRAVEEQQRTGVQESLCCLYVAMTRAAHALYMIVRPQPARDGKIGKLPATAAGLLRATLADRPDAPPSARLYECGDPEWRQPLTVDGLGSEDEAARPVKPARPLLLPLEGGRRRRREAVAPSASIRSLKVSGDRLLSLSASEFTERGSLWHAWCQEIGWLDDGLPPRDRLLEIAARVRIGGGPFEEDLDAFLTAIGRPAIRAVLLQSRYRPEQAGKLPAALGAVCRQEDLRLACHTERRFTLIDGDRHLSGMIDRLVVLSRGETPVAVEVLDFKTDAGGDASGRSAAYEEQLRLYARAAARSLGLDPGVSGATLVWLATGTVRNVPVR
ncbi:MAG: UvrD-helicase domain-containing protein [Planctomyces sp.]|nr:UvrD-helicase domain-containing protein [Planctomyces sp.]